MTAENSKSKRAQIVKGIIVLIVVWAIIALGVFVFNKSDTTAPKTTEVNPDMQNTIVSMIDSDKNIVTADTAKYDFTDLADKYWEKIQNDFPNRDSHIVKDNDNRHEAFEKYIINELKSAGFDDNNIELNKHSEKTIMNDDLYAVNIIATIEGRDTSKQVIMACGYDGVYDKLRPDLTNADDGSSAAITLAEAVGIAKSEDKPQYTVKFVFGDGEAEGLRGTAWFARTMKRNDVNSTVYAVRAIVSSDKVYGEKLGKCKVTGGVISGNEMKATEALDYAEFSAANWNITLDENKPDAKNVNPFSEYGIEYVDFLTDMKGDTVKTITSMLMGSK